MVLGAAVKDVDCDEGLVRLEGGGEVKKDLSLFEAMLIDFKSQLVGSVNRQAAGLTRLPHVIYRCLIPIERVIADVETRKLFENEKLGYIGCIAQLGTRLAFIYPCRRQEILNCSLLHDTALEKADTHD